MFVITSLERSLFEVTLLKCDYDITEHADLSSELHHMAYLITNNVSDMMTSSNGNIFCVKLSVSLAYGEENPPVIDGFPSQWANNAESVSRHHVKFPLTV